MFRNDDEFKGEGKEKLMKKEGEKTLALSVSEATAPPLITIKGTEEGTLK